MTKGQELGYFQYGGSTHCLIFRPGVIKDFTIGAIPQPTNPNAPLMLVHAKLATANYFCTRSRGRQSGVELDGRAPKLGTMTLRCMVRLIGPPQTDGEYVALRQAGGDEVIIHLHDYQRLYETAGLYEHVVQELLGCRSPEVAAHGLAHALDRLARDAADLRLLDLGAGTGIVGELARGLGVGVVIGLDALAAARDACLRDRPGIYFDYLVGDLADPGPDLVARLRRHHPDGLISAGAFGGTHAPATGLINAVALLPAGAPVVFTIDERWMHTDAPGGFRTSTTELLDSGQLELLERSRFQHRLTTTGEPLYYELLVAAKAVDINAR